MGVEAKIVRDKGMTDDNSREVIESNRVYIIDSTLMMYRYSRGIPPMSAGKERTEAVYGFGKMLLSLMAKQPGAVIAVFDHGQHNFRNYVLPTYKEHYVAMAPELKSQIERAKEMCDVLGVPVYSVNEVEADDVIGSLARKASRWAKEVVVVSTDRDFFQLIGLGADETKVLVPSAETHGLGKAPVLYDEIGARAWMKEKYGVGFRPRFMGDLKAIAGSASKDIPGVKGIGEKGAAKLVAQYGPVEKIVAGLSHMPSGKGSLREKLEVGLADLLKSKELTTIRTNVRLNQFKPEEIKGLKAYPANLAVAFFTTLGFKDLARKSRKLAGQILATQAAGLHEQVVAAESQGRSKTESLFL